MPKEAKASRIALEERIEEAEEMLCAGISPGRVERKLAADYNVSPRQARKYITRVYERWQARTSADAPFRREKVIMMAERFYAKALGSKQYTAAASALALLAKMSGALAQHDATSAAALAQLGPPPSDPTLILAWANRCLGICLNEVMQNRALDPERRFRWVAEIGGKLGMTHAKALLQAKLDDVANRVMPHGDADPTNRMEPVEGVAWPATSRFGSGDQRDESLCRPGAGPPSPEDAGADPGGGGEVGPPHQ